MADIFVYEVCRMKSSEAVVDGVHSQYLLWLLVEKRQMTRPVMEEQKSFKSFCGFPLMPS